MLKDLGLIPSPEKKERKEKKKNKGREKIVH
jgi:hypothetical protein